MPRVDQSVIFDFRSRVLSYLDLRVLHDDGVLLVSPSLTDIDLGCFIVMVLSERPLSLSDIQRLFSGFASTVRIRRVLRDLVRRKIITVRNGLYCVTSVNNVLNTCKT